VINIDAFGWFEKLSKSDSITEAKNAIMCKDSKKTDLKRDDVYNGVFEIEFQKLKNSLRELAFDYDMEHFVKSREDFILVMLTMLEEYYINKAKSELEVLKKKIKYEPVSVVFGKTKVLQKQFDEKVANYLILIGKLEAYKDLVNMLRCFDCSKT
jgi:hypothetical protein